jgi:hypothetical protein
MLAIGFEIAIEPPDQCARSALSRTLPIGEGIELVNEALGMDPAQAARANVELPGVIADDDGVGQEAMRLDAAPQGALGGDQDRIRVDLESRDAESVEVCGPGDLAGEDPPSPSTTSTWPGSRGEAFAIEATNLEAHARTVQTPSDAIYRRRLPRRIGRTRSAALDGDSD